MSGTLSGSGTGYKCNTTLNGVPAYEYNPHPDAILWAIGTLVLGTSTGICAFIGVPAIAKIILILAALGLLGTSGFMFYRAFKKETSMQCTPKSS